MIFNDTESPLNIGKRVPIAEAEIPQLPEKALVYCFCESKRKLFEDDFELRCHIELEHCKTVTAAWVCRCASEDDNFLRNCRACWTSYTYEELTRAVQHLLHVHFQPAKNTKISKEPQTISFLKNWISSTYVDIFDRAGGIQYFTSDAGNVSYSAEQLARFKPVTSADPASSRLITSNWDAEVYDGLPVRDRLPNRNGEPSNHSEEMLTRDRDIRADNAEEDIDDKLTPWNKPLRVTRHLLSNNEPDDQQRYRSKSF